MEKSLSFEDVHAKAIRLLEGGVVEVAGQFFRAYEFSGDDFPCGFCELDSACRPPINDVCEECDLITGQYHYLSFYKKS